MADIALDQGRTVIPRYCSYCDNPIPREKVRKNAVYCSRRCASLDLQGAYLGDQSSANGPKLPPSTTGAMHELMVCADLMRRGYHVFRAQSPSCPCDIMAMIDRRVFKVEVTTGYKRGDGGINFSKKSERYDFDIMAVVFYDNDIRYIKRSQAEPPPNLAYTLLDDYL